jgi:hypothetical protein
MFLNRSIHSPACKGGKLLFSIPREGEEIGTVMKSPSYSGSILELPPFDGYKKLDSINCIKRLTYLREYERRIIEPISQYPTDIFGYGTAMSRIKNMKCMITTV